ncbi:hypothetical protein Taro_047281 [Colocasia esculenta]|uniref:Disease resistance N-terminal domain-containing protein n=1 Tax=Colocasia esculenta TaxID=4460 RepID=A0A843WSF8_COLES|nr:hypothetical protein [Colocasia esculenta]
MEEAIRSAVAKAVEESAAANIGTLTPAASPVPSSSSSMPTCRDMISRIHVKARWLIRMLAWVRATLDDAEDMDITDESIRDWLRQLQEVADAAEDLLDEFPHEVLRLGFVGDGGWTSGSITELPGERNMTSEMDGLRDQDKAVDISLKCLLWFCAAKQSLNTHKRTGSRGYISSREEEHSSWKYLNKLPKI